MRTAKLFKNGNSQAVRLPKEFRFDGDEVCIKRVGSAVVLYEKNSGCQILHESIGKVTDDFMDQGRDQGVVDKRQPL